MLGKLHHNDTFGNALASAQAECWQDLPQFLNALFLSSLPFDGVRALTKRHHLSVNADDSAVNGIGRKLGLYAKAPHQTCSAGCAVRS
jgi:hypothetical protein